MEGNMRTGIAVAQKNWVDWIDVTDSEDTEFCNDIDKKKNSHNRDHSDCANIALITVVIEIQETQHQQNNINEPERFEAHQSCSNKTKLVLLLPSQICPAYSLSFTVQNDVLDVCRVFKFICWQSKVSLHWPLNFPFNTKIHKHDCVTSQSTSLNSLNMQLLMRKVKPRDWIFDVGGVLCAELLSVN